MAKVIIWLGAAPFRWDPLTALETGIGGSETAALHMSRELAKLGHEVVVYADVDPCSDVVSLKPGDASYPSYGDGKTEYGNVVLWNSYKLATEEARAEFGRPCDIFISSRQPEARRRLQPKCKQAWLWMHDIHVGPDWENLIGTDHDKILCLSNWARQRFLEYYPGVDPSKVVETANGLDTSLFENVFAETSPRHKHLVSGHPDTVKLEPGDQHSHLAMGFSSLRVTYSSSPDRGLDKLLSLWPTIRDISPAAELHVYYGFETWRKLALLHGPQSQLARIDCLEARLASTPGVVFHGRVGQVELAKSFLQSQLWLYPTDFLETSCISAMEAQAAGCKLVATRCGALPETVPGAWFVDGPTSAPGFDRRFLESVSAVLCDDSVVMRTPKTWEAVARQWNEWME